MTTETATNFNPFDFLWRDADKALPAMKLPEGGGIQGFAGQWTCSIVYRFWTPEKPEDYEVTPDFKRTNENGSFCYFLDYEVAKAAGDKMRQQYPPNTVWRWEIPTSNILNIMDDENRAKFGDVMSQEVTISSLMSKKSRHELHMITLPSAVQAMAIVAGFIDHKIFDYESLRVDPDVIDDAYRQMIIGGESSYEQSKLWQARVQLWAALGETNPKTYTLNQGKFDAQAGYLRACLGIIYRKTELWARVTSVPDPRVDAKTRAGKHLQLPVVAQIWKDKADLMRDLELEEHAIMPTNGHTNGHTNGNGKLKLPEVWANEIDSWKGYVREITAPYKGKPDAVVKAALRERDAEFQQTYMATAEDFIAWMNEVA